MSENKEIGLDDKNLNHTNTVSQQRLRHKTLGISTLPGVVSRGRMESVNGKNE